MVRRNQANQCYYHTLIFIILLFRKILFIISFILLLLQQQLLLLLQQHPDNERIIGFMQFWSNWKPLFNLYSYSFLYIDHSINEGEILPQELAIGSMVPIWTFFKEINSDGFFRTISMTFTEHRTFFSFREESVSFHTLDCHFDSGL